MITDQVVISRIADHWTDGGLFSASWANLVGHWAVRFFRKHQKPIGLSVESIFERWAENREDQETVRLIGQFLSVLSSEYDPDEPANSEHLLDLAKEQIQISKIRSTNEQAESLLLEGRAEEANQQMLAYRDVNLGAGSFIEPHSDFSAWVQAFEQNDQRPLFSYPGELGRLVGNAMHREGFVAWMGVEKAGKSYTLMDATYRCLKRRCRVAYFEAGDLGQNEVMMRLGERITSLPRRAGDYLIPKTDRKGSQFDVDALYDTVSIDQTVSPRKAFKAYRELCSDKPLFRVASYPNSTLTTAEIDGLLSQWDADDWTPDVVVIDYADILAPPAGMKDPLEQIDETWKHLRRISQKWHCLLLTATQASANAYNQSMPLSRKNFSGRKTKLAHVSGMLGLNVYSQSADAKAARPICWNWIVRRNDYYNENYQVEVHGCIGIGRPVITSRKKIYKSQKKSRLEDDADR